MVIGGSNRTQGFFEAKYTSTASDLYVHLLAEETTTSLPEASSAGAKEKLAPKENSSLTHEPTKIGESYEARRKFSNAKSISSTQFFEDQNKYTEMFSERINDTSSLVDRMKERLETLAFDILYGLNRLVTPKDPGNAHDIRALCRDVTDLMQKLHGKDAQAIPWDTRMKWVENVCDRIVPVTYGVTLQGYFGEMVAELRDDAWDLFELLSKENVETTKIA